MQGTLRTSIRFWLAVITGAAAWLLAVFSLFLALRFRLFPVPGDEQDIAVWILFLWGGPLLALPALVLGLTSPMPRRGKLLLVLPSILLLVAVLVASVGVTSRP